MFCENRQSVKRLWTTGNIWKRKNISLAIEVKLYKSLVLSTHYTTKAVVIVQKKNLAATRKFQRMLLDITGKDKVKSEEIRKQAGLKLENMLAKRRLRWLMAMACITDTEDQNSLSSYSLGIRRIEIPCRPRKTLAWRHHLTWQDAEELAASNGVWRRHVT